MLKVNSDVTKFNKWLQVNCRLLQAKGEMVYDLLIHLFAGYEQAQDCKFCKYIAKKKVKYEE
eukprot:5184976-Ditylum_brightwellii.AAC.1